jgi:hypothetical protein
MIILITTMVIIRAKKILGTLISRHFVKINFLFHFISFYSVGYRLDPSVLRILAL